MRRHQFELLSGDVLRLKQARLLSRIERRFGVVTEEHIIGPLRIPFTRVADPNRVLDEICEEDDRRERQLDRKLKDDELHLPYWAELWDSAIALGHYLVARASRGQTSAQSVFDLGAGMGFAGTVAAALGSRVLLGDIETACLLFATYNTLPWSHRCVARKVNWQRDRLGEKFDVILGADVVYDKTQWVYLEPFWRAHLANEGSVIIGEPGRPTGENFLTFIRSKGWHVSEETQQIPTRATPIKIFELRKLM